MWHLVNFSIVPIDIPLKNLLTQQSAHIDFLLKFDFVIPEISNSYSAHHLDSKLPLLRYLALAQVRCFALIQTHLNKATLHFGYLLLTHLWFRFVLFPAKIKGTLFAEMLPVNLPAESKFSLYNLKIPLPIPVPYQ